MKISINLTTCFFVGILAHAGCAQAADNDQQQMRRPQPTKPTALVGALNILVAGYSVYRMFSAADGEEQDFTTATLQLFPTVISWAAMHELLPKKPVLALGFGAITIDNVLIGMSYVVPKYTIPLTAVGTAITTYTGSLLLGTSYKSYRQNQQERAEVR